MEKQVRTNQWVLLLAALFIGATASLALVSMIRARDMIAFEYAKDLADAETLRAFSEKMVAAGRGYIITGDEDFLNRLDVARSQVARSMRDLQLHAYSADQNMALSDVDDAEQRYSDALDKLIDRRGRSSNILNISEAFERDLQPRRVELEGALDALEGQRRGLLEAAKERTLHESDRAMLFLCVSVAISLAQAAWFSLARAIS